MNLKPVALQNFLFDWELRFYLCKVYRLQNLVGLELPITNTFNFLVSLSLCANSPGFLQRGFFYWKRNLTSPPPKGINRVLLTRSIDRVGLRIFVPCFPAFFELLISLGTPSSEALQVRLDLWQHGLQNTR